MLILRLTPRGLKRPRPLTQRPRAISSSSASRQAAKRSGGNGRSLRHLALDHAHRVREAQAIRVEPARPGRLRHQLGRARRLARQRLRRAAVALDQIRGGFLHAYESVAQARIGIDSYVRFYNERRPYSSQADARRVLLRNLGAASAGGTNKWTLRRLGWTLSTGPTTDASAGLAGA